MALKKSKLSLYPNFFISWLIRASSHSSLRFFILRSSVSLPSAISPAVSSRTAARIFERAWFDCAMFIHSLLGFWLFEVRISTVCPLSSCWRIGKFLPSMRPPTQRFPTPVCMVYAKSSTVECGGRRYKSPLGENTYTSCSLRSELKLCVSNPSLPVSSAERMSANQESTPPPLLLTPL